MTNYYDTLVFSGSAMKGICILGALQYCYDNHLISGVKTLIGTSAGSFIAYLLCIGYTPYEIMVYLCTHKIYKDFQCFDILSMVNGEGALSFLPIYEYLERMTIEKLGQLVTFNDIKTKFNKNLIVTTYNYTLRKMEYLSWETHPDMPCLIALRMSATLPLLFNMYKYMNNYYIDGGIGDNFPILYDIKESTDSVISHRLGFVIDLENIGEDEKKDIPPFLEYIYSLLLIPTSQDVKNKISKARHIDIIKLSTPINPLDFDMSSTKKMETFSSGYQQAKKYFNPN
jgi:predicted acylesterase/phospholipase RssA